MITISNGQTTISSIEHADGFETTPDDRIELVKTVSSTGTGTVTVEDYGVVANGEIISLSAVFSATDYATLKTWWSGRTLCNVTFDDGTTMSNARILIRRTNYFDKMMSNYKKVDLEIWKV